MLHIYNSAIELGLARLVNDCTSRAHDLKHCSPVTNCLGVRNMASSPAPLTPSPPLALCGIGLQFVTRCNRSYVYAYVYMCIIRISWICTRICV